jgi:hypothetical protein
VAERSRKEYVYSLSFIVRAEIFCAKLCEIDE